MDIRRASGSRSTHNSGGIPRWSVRGKSSGRASHRSVRTLSRLAHQQADRNRYCNGSTTACLGGESVLRGRRWLERHCYDTFVCKTIIAAIGAPWVYSLSVALCFMRVDHVNNGGAHRMPFHPICLL